MSTRLALRHVSVVDDAGTCCLLFLPMSELLPNGDDIEACTLDQSMGMPMNINSYLFIYFYFYFYFYCDFDFLIFIYYLFLLHKHYS